MQQYQAVLTGITRSGNGGDGMWTVNYEVPELLARNANDATPRPLTGSFQIQSAQLEEVKRYLGAGTFPVTLPPVV